ncbi:glycosyltransferase [Arenibacter sp. GZD96]|uniref:glycosyltransferase n=1 Tax=Aurantibrevibacter litoralis TaxID=3106030 RepID=UPI002AFE5275|nr:glycosyltransferase [Arenibacter sp. GZD-96]MEA1786351.1 glycosyltransferase [Arenibacter sp. GZD-96]
MELNFSFIIPVYNRPEEVRELLQSLSQQTYSKPFEIVLVEDGSTDTAQEVVSCFAETLHITYLIKSNTGPGDSRNYGMRRAKGNYYIILDSDCILPPDYLHIVAHYLEHNWVPCYGGPDKAHASFSKIQKAINYAMTSLLTTGGIRGNAAALNKFQPRSFNMGMSKTVFEATQGFGNIHPGEDPDLSFRIWKHGFKTALVPRAFVYHKRRITWSSFYKQVKKFGLVRPILNKWHPGTAKLTYWFPAIFSLFSIFSLVGLFLGFVYPIMVVGVYFLLIFFHSWFTNRDFIVALFSVFAVILQFTGYGFGYLRAVSMLYFSKRTPEELFPTLFFKSNQES